MNEQKQPQPSPSATFLSAVRKIDKDVRDKPVDDDNPLIDMLQEVAIDPELQPEEQKELKKLHRDERKFVRSLAEKAALSIRIASGEDLALEVEMIEGLRRGLGNIGIDASGIEGFRRKDIEETANREKKESSLANYVPTVLPEYDKAIKEIDHGEGKWTPRDARAIASGFLDIYVPIQKQLDEKSIRGERKLDAIATLNSFSHTFVERLSEFPDDIQATSAINDIEEKVVGMLEQRANDFELGRIQRYRDTDGIGDIPEIKLLRSRVLNGIRTEFITHKVLDKNKSELGMTDISFSSIEQDVKEGWDLSLTHESGKVYYVDTKSAAAFSDLINKQDKNITVLQPNIAIKRNSSAGPVIVVAAGSLAGIRQERNRLIATNPDGLIDALQYAINTIDN